MRIGNCDLNSELFFVVEEGQFNLGDFQKALQMVEVTAKTGASAIEFQLAYADDFYIRSEAGHAIYKTREFSDEQLKLLVSFTKESRLEFIATCLSHRLVEKMAKAGSSGFNINASDINNPYIIDAVIDSNLPFFVSTPLATEKEIKWVLARIDKKGALERFRMLHGQHSMASGKEWVEVEDTALGYLKRLSELSGKQVGYIDHTATTWMPSAAVAAGATIISKHLTLSSVYKGPDWAICLEPAVMQTTIANARAVYKSMKTTSKELAKGEDLDRTVMRRSIVAETAIPKGKKIEWNDLGFKRPGTGIAPDEAENIIGRAAARDIIKDELFSEDMFK